VYKALSKHEQSPVGCCQCR